jgi:hypothetical protein
MQVLQKMAIRIVFIVTANILCTTIEAQNYTPNVSDANLYTSSPDVAGIAGNGPISLATGTASASIPVYEVKCGSLSLPIALSYSYNGFDATQEASWVGLGWNLIAGGMVTRNMQGTSDSTRNGGVNYGQYNIHDSLFQSNNSNFIQNIYINDRHASYDPGPDIFQGNFNGYSGNFYWYNGKQYMLSYSKQFKVNWPNVTQSMTITTADGTSYLFGQVEQTKVFFPGIHWVIYNAGWYLTSVVSADKMDTISLNYNTYSWTQLSSPYALNYVQGTYDELPISDTNTAVTTLPLLQSITCRNVRVNFTHSAAARTDLQGNSPSLQEIDVIDSISGDTVKKASFTYGYFNQTATNPAYVERLKLKQFSLINPASSSDVQSYNFSYMDEYSTVFPQKNYPAPDYWGFYNGTGGLFDGAYDSLVRTPNLTYCSYGALDTIGYPTGGFTTYQYQLNDYFYSPAKAFKPGPGLRIQSISHFLPGASVPASSKIYSYLADNGSSSSGALSYATQVSGPIYVSDSIDFNLFVLANNNPGSPVLSNVLYYGKVSEQSGSGKEKHKIDYYFQSFSHLFTDVELNKKIDYRYDSTLSAFTPLSILTNSYDTTVDSSFLSINAYTDSSYASVSQPDSVKFKFGYTYNYNNTYWKHLDSQRVVQYDNLNDSSVSTTKFNYNAVRNLDSTRETLPDGRGVIHKFKYPDDYSSAITGNMVAANIIGPVIESQTWLQNTGAGPKMVSGSITGYDQTIFKPVSTYNLEPASPLSTLNNENLSGGKYSSLVSDTSNYVLKGQLYYDANNNLDQNSKTSDINKSYVWDYRHSVPIAEVNNGAATEIAYTSFESDGSGNWSIPDTTRNRGVAITGSQSYNLVTGKTISATVPSGKQYIVSFWLYVGASGMTVKANGTTISPGPVGLTKSFMSYYEYLLPNTTTSVSITATSAVIDELRLHPIDAQMTTYTYLPLIGKSSICSPNNTILYYEYDGFNRLKDIRDMDKNIVKLYDYQLQQPYTYYNIAENANFTRSNCGCDSLGTVVNYAVAANTYNSHASQTDANQAALNDIAANGQSYANTHGSCTVIHCIGNDRKIVFCVTCEISPQIITSSVMHGLHNYTCTYHYEWSDGTRSIDYTEMEATSCPITN